MNSEFFTPTKPLTIIDQINRVAAATGTHLAAIRCSAADWNGHRIHCEWNSCRRYYVVRYFYGGDHVLERDEDFAVAVEAAIREFERQGRGASLVVIPRDEDVAAAEAHPRLRRRTDEAVRESEPWRDWRFAEVNQAIEMEKRFGVPHCRHLIDAADPEDYRRRVDAEFAAKRADRLAATAH